MERDDIAAGSADSCTNFNSHAHVERDVCKMPINSVISISTHTLTWSVTHYNKNGISYNEISTHTLTWSVTGKGKNKIVYDGISTHTLTWSVTVNAKQ